MNEATLMTPQQSEQPELSEQAEDIRPLPATGPCVERLAARLAGTAGSEREAVLEEFWAGVARGGTPLVEEVPGEAGSGHRVVTFLWRGHHATRQVLLVANRLVDRSNLTRSLLHRLSDTDVWHLSYRLRADHRGSYKMAADISTGPLPEDPVRLQQRLHALMPHAASDPLNRRPMPSRWGASDSSVYALPDAPEQPWAQRRTGLPAGELARHRFTSAALGGDRDVWVYLPPEGPAPESGRREQPELPVLLLADGDMWFGRLGFRHTLDALIADGALPPLAVLSPDAVDNATRWQDLGAREPFVSFLADELLPWAAGRWPLTTDPARTAVCGQSLGAMTALYAAHIRPERFGRVLAQSSSLWWRPGLAPGVPKTVQGTVPWLVTQFHEAAPRPVTVHLDVGLHEGAMVLYSRALYEVLRARGHQVSLNEYNGGHDYACWRGALADGLVRLLGGPG
ncbi:enterochelin esterase [Streptomyces physcomitrii]|nr:enterochelin esterase [Streptomyces physcomitrii]